MVKLPAWARGPYELMEHAEGHFYGNDDVDRRMALIGFDNAIEVIITTYLQLNPKLRGGATFRKEDVKKWLQNYHSKIEFFEHFTEINDFPLESSTAEIIWYYTLRNELYHSGNGMIPERHCLNGVRAAAIEVFEALFGMNVTSILDVSRKEDSQHERGISAIATFQNKFLQSYIAFERMLMATALATGIEADHRSQGVVRLWGVIKEQAHSDINEYDSVVQKARNIRNQLVHRGITDSNEQDLLHLSNQLDDLVAYLQSYAFSLDLLPILEERYGDWVQPEIVGVRIIHKSGITFLEVSTQVSGLFDEETKRVDLGFIADEDEPLFSPNQRAQQNTDRFFDDLDLFSIVMTGIGDILFTDEGIKEAVKLSGADGTGKNGDITRRP